MAHIDPYLTFDGNCEEAFNHYKSVFNSEFDTFQRFSDIPESDDYQVKNEDKDKIMHVSMKIGDNTLMGSDTSSDHGPEIKQGNNFSISVFAESQEKADKYFEALSEDGKVTMPLQNTFWGSYYGMCIDKFGVNWMISAEVEE